MSLAVLKLDILARRCLVIRRPAQQWSSSAFNVSLSCRGVSTSSSSSSEDKEVIVQNSTAESTQVVPSAEVQQFVASLTPEHRNELLIEIQKVDSLDLRQRAEDKLASYRWRSRFGRPSSFPKLGADPTGTYCEIPEGWLREKAAVALKPTPLQLRQLTLFNALPFIGFGFLDNVIMIVAGDYIDITIGSMFAISTLAAAALGNTISDLAGIGSAWYVETAAEKVGVKAPNLTTTQMESSSARWCANAGRAVGVVVGCILGMFPLLLISTNKEDNGAKKSNSEQGSESKNSTPKEDVVTSSAIESSSIPPDKKA